MDDLVNWERLKHDILVHLDIQTEAEVGGIEFSSSAPSSSGWLACRSPFREDSSPSAGVNVAGTSGELGQYKDFGDESAGCDFFGLMAKLGRFSDRMEAMRHFARIAGISLPQSSSIVPDDESRDGEEDPGEAETTDKVAKFEACLFDVVNKPECRVHTLMWMRKKPGLKSSASELGLDAVERAGATPGYWLGRAVVAFPVRDPVNLRNIIGYTVYRADGHDWPEYKALKQRKCHNIGPSGVIIGGSPEEIDSATDHYFPEGPTCGIALSNYLPRGHVFITSSAGATCFRPEFAQHSKGKLSHVFGDADRPGTHGSCRRAEVLLSVAASVKLGLLPYSIASKHGKDVRDLVNDGGIVPFLRTLSESVPATPESIASIRKQYPLKPPLPEIELPGGERSITQFAVEISKMLGRKKKIFSYGGVPVRPYLDKGSVSLKPQRATSFCSDIETVAQPVRIVRVKGEDQASPTICKKSMAELVIDSMAYRSRLPKITVVSNCPVLTFFQNQLKVVTGYDPSTGIWAMGDAPQELVISEAIKTLKELKTDFHFASESDGSRMLAAVITPCLVLGGLLGPNRAPITVLEADKPQTGKGFTVRLIGLIYRTNPSIVTQRKVGNGSDQESFDKMLISGKSFISFDNIVGKFSNPALDSFCTESTYLARIPYSPPVEIDPTRTVLFATTNRADSSQDTAYRSSIIRVRKHADDYKYKIYPEGGLLQHVEANQTRYLGAVFSIVKEWYRRGKPVSSSAFHDSAYWAAVLANIVEEILGEPPLFAGHREVQKRISSPQMNWLRDLAIAVKDSEMLGAQLRGGELVSIVNERDVQIPGISTEEEMDEKDFEKAARSIGTKISRFLKNSESEFFIEDFKISKIRVDDSKGGHNEYVFSSFSATSRNSPQDGAKGKHLFPQLPQVDGHKSIQSNSVSMSTVEGVCNSSETRLAVAETGLVSAGGLADPDCGHPDHNDSSRWINAGGMMRCPRCKADRQWSEQVCLSGNGIVC